MKMLKSAVIGATFLLGTLYAQAGELQVNTLTSEQIKDFRVKMTTQNKLNLGSNKIMVKIFHDGHLHSDYDVKLKVYAHDGKAVVYQDMKNRNDKKYVFNVNLNDKSNHGYLLSYRLRGGVIHYAKGRLSF